MTKISPLRIAFEAYAECWENIDVFVRIVWPWLIPGALIVVGHDLLSQAFDGEHQVELMVLLLTALTILCIPFASIWHRVLAARDNVQAIKTSVLGPHDGKYLLTAVVLHGPWYVLLFGLGGIPSLNKWLLTSEVGLAVNMALHLFGLIWFACVWRLSLCLPAIALDKTNAGFRRSLILSQGNTLRILAAVMLIGIPLFILVLIGQALVIAVLSHIGFPFGKFVAPIFGFFAATVLSTFLSVTYDELDSP